jgi:hypothetical protein
MVQLDWFGAAARPSVTPDNDFLPEMKMKADM